MTINPIQNITAPTTATAPAYFTATPNCPSPLWGQDGYAPSVESPYPSYPTTENAPESSFSSIVGKTKGEFTSDTYLSMLSELCRDGFITSDQMHELATSFITKMVLARVQEEQLKGAAFDLDAFVKSYTLALDDLLAELMELANKSSDRNKEFLRDFADKTAAVLSGNNTDIVAE
jgi:hypothetical protein